MTTDMIIEILVAAYEEPIEEIDNAEELANYFQLLNGGI